MKYINKIDALHGKKSKCGKFTINIDKGYLAVACNFHDGKDRIVYSESIDNIENIFQDLYKVWNFEPMRMTTKDDKPKRKIGINLLVDKNGIVLAQESSTSIRFYDKKAYFSYAFAEDWHGFVEEMKNECGCRVVEL